MKIFDLFGKEPESHLSNPIRSANNLNMRRSWLKDQDRNKFSGSEHKLEAGWWFKKQKRSRKLTSVSS